MNELDWTEKYRPKRLKDVLGNAKATSELRKWAESWDKAKPVSKGVILAGPAGCGKTSSAVALAKEFGWSLIELNASDARNMTKIRQVATTGALNQTFASDGQYLTSSSGGRKLIVLDEADSLYEGAAQTTGPDKKDLSDRGGKRAIIDTIERTRQPIILIVNDLYALLKGSGNALRNITLTIRFYKIKEVTIQQMIRNIAESEKIRLSPNVIESLARMAEGDLRAAINDLQSLAIGRTAVTVDAISAVGARDLKITIFDAIRDVFRGTSTSRIRQRFMSVDETPDNIILWIDENLPIEYKRPDDLVNGFNMLSRADVFLGRVRRRQHYKFQGYSKDLMTAGVASVKQHSYSGWVKYNFPGWLKKMAQTKESRSIYNGLSKKIGRHNHVSSKVVKSELILPFRQMFKSDKEFAVNMISQLDLDRDEIAYLLSDKSASNRVKSLQEEVKRFQDTQIRDKAEMKKEEEAKVEKLGKKAKGKGRSDKKPTKKDKKKETAKPKPADKGTGKGKKMEEEHEEEDIETSKKKEVQKSLFDF